MASEEWARSLNDATLIHAYDEAIRVKDEAYRALDMAKERLAVLAAEYRRRREAETP